MLKTAEVSDAQALRETKPIPGQPGSRQAKPFWIGLSRLEMKPRLTMSLSRRTKPFLRFVHIADGSSLRDRLG